MPSTQPRLSYNTLLLLPLLVLLLLPRVLLAVLPLPELRLVLAVPLSLPLVPLQPLSHLPVLVFHLYKAIATPPTKPWPWRYERLNTFSPKVMPVSIPRSALVSPLARGCSLVGRPLIHAYPFSLDLPLLLVYLPLLLTYLSLLLIHSTLLVVYQYLLLIHAFPIYHPISHMYVCYCSHPFLSSFISPHFSHARYCSPPFRTSCCHGVRYDVNPSKTGLMATGGDGRGWVVYWYSTV